MGPKLSKISYKMSKEEEKRGYVSETEESKKPTPPPTFTKCNPSKKSSGSKILKKKTSSKNPTNATKSTLVPVPTTSTPTSAQYTSNTSLSSSCNGDGETACVPWPTHSSERGTKKRRTKAVLGAAANIPGDNPPHPVPAGAGVTPAATSSSNPSNSLKLAVKKSKPWLFKGFGKKDTEFPEPQKSSLPEASSAACVCTGYRRSSSDVLNRSNDSSSSVPANNQNHAEEVSISISVHLGNTSRICTPPSVLRLFNPEDYPIEDEDEKMRRQRAKEIEEGVELSDKLGVLSFTADKDSSYHQVHTQVDFIHCLVPDLKEITSCSFYWGKIDRYEAEKLLEGKPEGTFLLRDSAQEEYLFSVSFRRYGRSLHARIEQWNHSFSFDAHDPSVFSSPTVTGLIEHYKDPSCCMFFEPMLTIRLHRNFTFNLQHLARSVICNQIRYDAVNVLPLPKQLKTYCKEYHYKQRVRVRTFAD